jgi:aminoglycoside phosphotransferase (APT) family kinase protein
MSAQVSSVEAGNQQALFAWVADVCGGEVIGTELASGGNRRQSWAVDVRRADGSIRECFLRHDPRVEVVGVEPHTIDREADVYRAIAAIPVLAPRLIADSKNLRAILVERAHGIAEFRHSKDAAAKQAVTAAFMTNLASLHRYDTRQVDLDGGGKGRIADHVKRDVAIWRAMYDEVRRPDPLLDLAFGWLDAQMPDPDGPVVLVHGDAGPGNFLFDHDRLTALIDWEFAHLGDPLEDVAWFSMRCVMEPVPDYFGALEIYERAAGHAIDRARLRYHRVLVSTRVAVIRHRNFASEPAYAIVSRGLNRRLLVEALAAAGEVDLPRPEPIAAPATPQSAYFAKVIDELGNIVLPRSSDKRVIAVAKNSAKVIKYLKAIDQLGPSIEAAKLLALTELLGTEPQSIAAGELALSEAVRASRISFNRALDYFHRETTWSAQLSAEASGSIAHRHYHQI